MADLSGITAIRPGSSTTIVRVVAYGATVAIAQPLYLDESDNEHKLADADASQAASNAVGISLTPGVDGGFGVIATGGSVILVGTTMVVGDTYYVSATAGGIMPQEDLVSGDWVHRLGTASSTTELKLSISPTAIQVP